MSYFSQEKKQQRGKESQLTIHPEQMKRDSTSPGEAEIMDIQAAHIDSLLNQL